MLDGWANIFEKVELIPGDKGVFDVTLDGQLIYSKHTTGRHAEPGEVRALVEQALGPPVRQD